MMVERVLWRIAVGCAALLLFAPMTPRTSWTYLPQSESGPGGGMTHSAGWDWIAPLSVTVARSVIHPAPAVAYFAAIAIVGMVAALVLLGSWLHHSAGESRP